MNKIWWVCLGAVVSLHAAHAATPITATQRDQVIEKLPLITKNRAASQTTTLANPEAAALAARELITAARQTGEVLLSLRGDIDQAALAAERARNDMALLREALSQETTRLNEAAENAGRTARRLTENLGRERDQMQTLGIHLDTQASGVIDAVERQSRMVADASDLAQAQLRATHHHHRLPEPVLPEL